MLDRARRHSVLELDGVTSTSLDLVLGLFQLYPDAEQDNLERNVWLAARDLIVSRFCAAEHMIIQECLARLISETLPSK